MAGERKIVHESRARVQDVQQHALAFPHADGIAEAEHAVVDGRVAVDDFLIAFSAALRVTFPVVERKEDLLVVGRGIRCRIDHEETEFSGVGGAIEIVAGRHVRVIPAETGGLRNPGIALLAAVRRRSRASLPPWPHPAGRECAGRASAQYRECIGFVDHIDRDLLALSDADEVAGNPAVECGGADDFARSDFEADWRDADGVVSGKLRLSGQSEGAPQQRGPSQARERNR